MDKRRAAAVSVPIATHADGSEAYCLAKLVRLRIQWARHRDVDEQFIETLEDVKRIRAWERIPPEQPYGSLDAMIKAELGVPAATIERSVAVFTRDRAMNPLELAAPGKIGNGRSRDYHIISTPHQQGTSADYLTARIARDRPDILERMKAGEYPSVRRAAMDAGIVKPTVTHGVSADAFARAARKHLTYDQIEQLVEQLAEMLEAAGLGFLERTT